MEPVLLIIIVGLAGGVAVGLQSPLANILSQRLGLLESVFIVHLGGALIALIPLLILGHRLGQWRTVPWYALGAGAFGLAVIASVSYMIPRVGVAAAVTTLVSGQLLVGTILDHFALLGSAGHPFNATRALGLGIVLIGVWVTVR